MWASVVMALISLFSVMIIMGPFVMALIFVLNHLYLFVTPLLTIFLTYFSFQIKSFLWEYLKPLLEIFVQILLVKFNLKAPTTAAPLPSVQLISATPIEFGREMFESGLQKAVNFLKDDSQGVLGIWGMGGVGKTTLLEHINNTMGKNPSSFGFNKVVLVTASRGCTTEKIQSQLKKKLGLIIEQDWEGGETTDILTTDMLATYIFNYLNDKSFAILLDDLWGYLELKKVGIPLPMGMVGDYKRKLILTSRLKKVCYNMGAREHALIKVDCLSTADARLLFRRTVGEDVIGSDLTILTHADIVADLCGGLPIALKAVGRAMAGARDVNVWKDAVDEIKESNSKAKFFATHEIAGTEDDPLPILKFSYDHLKDTEEKECFLHCALWPEDFEIDIDDLIRCWIGHGLLETYRRGYKIINSFQQACLLERVTKPVGYEISLRKQYVKLHDVIRHMALWVASDCGANENKWKVLAGQDLLEAPRDEESWREAHKISLMFNKIESLPSNIQSTPNLTTLMLQENNFYVDGGLRMSKYFNSLKYLDISRCYDLECFPTEICGLTKLEYLNISYTLIRSLPEELKALVNIKYLIARELYMIDTRIPAKLLSKLAKLIELDLFKSRGEVFVSSVIDNLDCLKGRLKGLGITISTVSHLQKLVQLHGIPISSLYLEDMEGLDRSLELSSHDFLGSNTYGQT